MKDMYFGIDPGLRETAIVYVSMDDNEADPIIGWGYIQLKDKSIPEHVELLKSIYGIHQPRRIYIEDYTPRAGYDSDPKMFQLVDQIRGLDEARSTTLSNSGITKIITKGMLNVLFGNKAFPTGHHRDVESAARILLLGLLRDKSIPLNSVIYRQLQAYADKAHPAFKQLVQLEY